MDEEREKTWTLTVEIPVTLVIAVDLAGLPENLDDALLLSRLAIRNVAAEIDTLDTWRLSAPPCLVSELRMQPTTSKSKIIGFSAIDRARSRFTQQRARKTA